MFGMGGSKPKPTAPRDTASAPSRKPALLSVAIKLTAEQKDKLALLGGDGWLREQIERAALPVPDQ